MKYQFDEIAFFDDRAHFPLPVEALMLWGQDDVAYVKTSIKNNEKIWAVYSADGICIGETKNKNAAVTIVFRNDLSPYLVH